MIARGGWYGDYGDPTTFLGLYRTGDGNNDRKYECPEFDALLDRAAAELDPAKRLAILTEAERMIVERDAPVIPICHYVTVYMYDPARLTGLSRHPRLEQYLGRLQMKK
jgi:oligopeptide transport system substrate-binding protein